MPSSNIKNIGLMTILSLSSTACAQINTRPRRSSPARIIAGVVVAVVVVLLLMTICCCMMVRRRRARAGPNTATPGKGRFGFPGPFGRSGGGMFGAGANQGNNLTGATGGATGPGYGHTGAAPQSHIPGHSNGNISQPPPAYGKDAAAQNGGYQPPQNFQGQTGMGQGGYAPPSGAPPLMHTTGQNQNNNFAGGFKV